MSKFDDAMECIGQAMFDYTTESLTETDTEIKQSINTLLDSLNEGYVVITWPDSQLLMDEDWFKDEAILETEGVFGSSAYFVPIKRII